MLLDFKANKLVRKLEVWRDAFRQLCTCALMDSDDRFAIRRIGVYFTRVGCLCGGNLVELLDKASGTEDTLEARRADLGEFLGRLAPGTA